jgi:hypothetical protein
VERGIGPVKQDGLGKRTSAVTDHLKAAGYFSQSPNIRQRTAYQHQTPDSSLQEAIEWCVVAEFVKAAGEQIGPHGMVCKLPLHIEPPAHDGQVISPFEIASRQPLPDSDEHPHSEEPDEEFEKVEPLRIEGGKLPIRDPQVMCNCQHPD